MNTLPPCCEDTIAGCENDAVEVVDRMIEETLGQVRRMSRPLMGGAHQAPFDGEVMGSFVRFAILTEVRARLTGEPVDEKTAIERFKRESVMVPA